MAASVGSASRTVPASTAPTTAPTMTSELKIEIEAKRQKTAGPDLRNGEAAAEDAEDHY